MSKTNDGYTTDSFKGIPIAIEYCGDGSVIICKEILDEIRDALGKYPDKPDLERLYTLLKETL